VRPPHPPKRVRTDDDEEGQHTFTAEQVDRLLAEAKRTDKLWSTARGLSQAAANAVRGDGTYALYTLAVRLGLRRGELLGLRWKDVDFDRKIIRVRQQVTRDDDGYRISSTLKTPAARRDLPLEDDIAALLHHLRSKLGTRAQVKDLVFPDKAGNERDPQSITRNFSRLVKRLGFEGLHLHDLRHTAVTRWRRAGVDVEVAAALAGHEKADVTANIYSDADMDRKRAALKQAS
jgi:integrase